MSSTSASAASASIFIWSRPLLMASWWLPENAV
jgi:hypothetical protein